LLVGVLVHPVDAQQAARASSASIISRMVSKGPVGPDDRPGRRDWPDSAEPAVAQPVVATAAAMPMDVP